MGVLWGAMQQWLLVLYCERGHVPSSRQCEPACFLFSASKDCMLLGIVLSWLLPSTSWLMGPLPVCLSVGRHSPSPAPIQVHYYVFKTHMSGFFQTSFYFGYTAMFCFGLALVCGSIGYFAASGFVRTIYR